MESPIEFSSFYRLLNSVKEGDESQKELLEAELQKYKNGDLASSHLHELGQLFLFIGVSEIYKYTNEEDFNVIGNFSKEQWEALSDEKESGLPQYLANKMIKFSKNINIAKKISEKWKKPQREINKHTTQMARYITEGLIDVLE